MLIPFSCCCYNNNQIFTFALKFALQCSKRGEGSKMARTDAPCRACRYQYFLLPFYYRGQPPYGRDHNRPRRTQPVASAAFHTATRASRALRFNHIGEVFEFHVLRPFTESFPYNHPIRVSYGNPCNTAGHYIIPFYE